MSTLEDMHEECEECGVDLEVGQIGECDDCQAEETHEDIAPSM